MVKKYSIITGATLLFTASAPVSKPSSESRPYQAGQSGTADTYPEMLLNTEIPIDHIIVVMQENRSSTTIFINFL
jgi:phospholipase C